MRARHLVQRMGVGAVALMAASLPAVVLGARPAAASTSVNVGYFYDDANSSGAAAGSDLFSAAFPAATPANPTPTGAGTADYKAISPGAKPGTVYHLTDLPLSTTKAAASNPFLVFDTVIVYQVCGIGDAGSPIIGWLNGFVNAGKKLIISDSDRCNAGDGTQPNYSGFLFPFQTNNPGPQGADGVLTQVEQTQLTAGYPIPPPGGSVSPGSSSQVGDANIFTTFSSGWCVAVRGTNINNVTGPIVSYARSGGAGATGLAIYIGVDMAATGNTAFHQQEFDDALAQPWNPDNLPCTGAASGVNTLTQNVTQATGTPQQVVASITDNAGNSVGGAKVDFKVTNTKTGAAAGVTSAAAPNAGKAQTVYSDCAGYAVFTLTSSTAGTDYVQVSFTDAGGNVHSGQPSTVNWAAGAAPSPAALTQGYYLDATDGGIFTYGAPATFRGSAGGQALNQPVVGMAACGSSYYLVASDGGIFTYGPRARFLGSTGALKLNKPIVGMAVTPDDNGYWLVATDGGIFTFGNAAFKGSTGAVKLNQPIVAMAPTPTGQGYYLVASDGGIFTFGDAVFRGSTGAVKLNQPIVGMAVTPTGLGYWLVATDGGIFTFGDAAFKGSTGAVKLNQPIVGMATTPSGLGYWLDASDGGIFTFGDAQFLGSAGGLKLNKPTVGMASAV